MRPLPIVASDVCESRAATHDAGVECKETLIDTDEETVATGIQKGADSGRTQTVVAAKRHGDLAIESYESFSGAEPDESAVVASNALHLVTGEAVGGCEGAHRQPLRDERRHDGEGDHDGDDCGAEAEVCRHVQQDLVGDAGYRVELPVYPSCPVDYLSECDDVTLVGPAIGRSLVTFACTIGIRLRCATGI